MKKEVDKFVGLKSMLAHHFLLSLYRTAGDETHRFFWVTMRFIKEMTLDATEDTGASQFKLLHAVVVGRLQLLHITTRLFCFNCERKKI
jgi:hypothetical protein